MLSAFELRGRIGLEQAIFEECESQATRKPALSWSTITDDFTSGSHRVFILLSLLPDDIICSLIKNTLAYDMLNDDAVGRFVRSHMLPRSYAPCSGVYVNIIRFDGGVMISTSQSDENGKWLKYNEIENLLDKMKAYIANDQADYQDNFAIDRAVPGWQGKCTLTDRRYPVSGDTTEKIRGWIELTRREYCNNVDPHQQQERFLRTPMEVGWAQNIPRRLKHHVDNASTTTLFALVNAITRLRVTAEFRFPPPQQLMLFPVWYDPSKELFKVAEILGSILCSSYWFYGGLNHTLAGGSVEPTLTPEADEWDNSVTEAIQRLGKYAYVDQELFKAISLQDLLKRAENKASIKREVEDMEANLDRMKEEYAAKREELKKEISHRAEAAALLQTKKASIVPASSASTSLQQLEGLLAISKKRQDLRRAKELVLVVVDAVTDEARQEAREELLELDHDVVSEAVDGFVAKERKWINEQRDHCDKLLTEIRQSVEKSSRDEHDL